ncbi:MAG: NADH-quinone oxidoreductase subunit N, partial [Myxococcota bacterium]|nr:NADH-quinone oxidoreductase subunit N [Myxococcota bacterium]
ALTGPHRLFAGTVIVDSYAIFFNYVLLLSAAGALLLGHDYLERVGVDLLEYNPLVLFTVFGMMVLVISYDLMMMFIAVELMSIGLYVLCGVNRGDPRAVEAAFKYLVLGAFASGILLYGIALIFGATGTTKLDGIATWIMAGHGLAGDPILSAGFALLLCGLAFKIAAAPFHMWSPDVYQGASTPITAFMATGVKAASFAALGRVLLVAFLGTKLEWEWVLWLMAAGTILVGNFAALVQQDLKRMLAYSSVGHAGFLLMAVVAAPAGNLAGNGRVGGLLLYLLAYTIMNLGAFAAVSLLARNGSEDTSIDQLSGLAERHPLVAAGLSICLLSLAGIPPTVGFVGKFYLFAAAVEGGFIGLAVVGALGGAVGVYYYLRPIVNMYMRPVGESLAPALNRPALATLGLASVAVLALGLYPGPLVDWCMSSLLSLVAFVA